MKGDRSSNLSAPAKSAKQKKPFPVAPRRLPSKNALHRPFEGEGYEPSAQKVVAGTRRRDPNQKRTAPPQKENEKRLKETPGKDSTCGTLLDSCRRKAEKAAATEDEASRNVEAALAGIAKLKKLVSTNPTAQKELKRAYDAAGIRITQRTANEFTPLVKLVFPKKIQKPATVSRYASALRLAEEEGIKPNGFVEFVRQNGGLAACASRAAAKRRTAGGGSGQTGAALANALRDRRQNAPTIRLPKSLKLPKNGLITLLVEPAKTGEWAILGFRVVPPKATTAFARIEVKAAD